MPTPSTFIPRSKRCAILGTAVFEQACRAGKSALEATEAQIEAHFSQVWWANNLKETVDRAMVLGALAIENRARYSHIAFELDPRNVDVAVRTIEHLYRAEQARCRNYENTTRLAVTILAEVRLFVRWYRRFGDRAMWNDMVETLTTNPAHPMPECAAAE